MWNPCRLRRMIGISFVAALAVAMAVSCTNLPARAEGKIKIAFVGDSSADGLWGGFTRMMTRDSCMKGQFELLRLGKNGTGLTRPEKFDWVAETAHVNEKDHPDLYVSSLGLNDRQSIVIDGKVTGLQSADYGPRYRERASAMIKNATATGAGLIWVGLAAMRETAANADAITKNKLFAAAAEGAGPHVRFVDRRKFEFIGGETFSTYGALEPGGALVALRNADGMHFTPAAEEKAAAELLPQILASLRARNVPGATACQK
jgi:hypothetical protein